MDKNEMIGRVEDALGWVKNNPWKASTIFLGVLVLVFTISSCA